MKYTKVLLGDEARQALNRGVQQVADPVSRTMGAKGKNGVYREWGAPVITNDGVSIARTIKPKDEFERMGADLIKEAAERSNADAGDGTTTVTVIASELISAGLSHDSPMQLREELEREGKEVVAKLKNIATPIASKEDILNVARISVEDEEMAQIVTDATEKAGKRGAVIVEEGTGYSIETEVTNGYFWNRGYISPYMVTDPAKNESVLEEPIVVVTDRMMNLNKDLVPLLMALHQNGARSVVVVADSVSGELLATIIANRIKGVLSVVCIPKPETKEELEDIAVIAGATAVTKELNIKSIEPQHVGKVSKMIATQTKTIITAPMTDALQKRINDIEEQIKANPEDEKLKERLAKLSDGIVVIKVGAKTEVERKYKKLKIDDAVSACKSALDEGIVPGAGYALYTIAESVKNPVLKQALRAPYNTILKNAGITPDGHTYNVKTGKQVSDLVSEGIIDPAKVERCAVENAISLASTLLTVESLIVETEEKQEK